MLARLENAHQQVVAAAKNSRWNHAGSVRLSAEAFRWYGLDLTVMDPQEAAKRVRASAIYDRLIDGLDCWAGNIRNSGEDGPSVPGIEADLADDNSAPRTVADLADDDPWRRQMRAAVARKDQPALKAMAEERGVLSRPAIQLTELAGRLCVDNWPTAERLLLLAQHRHPSVSIRQPSPFGLGAPRYGSPTPGP
jgi:hypothetical protein